GRLADDAQCGLHRHGRNPLDKAGDAQASDFLVIGDRDVDRRLEVALHKRGNRGKDDADEPLHVAGPTTIESSICSTEHEWVAGPGLAVDRNDITMAGQDHPRDIGWTDGGPEIAL